jgi:hypothetical protein
MKHAVMITYHNGEVVQTRRRSSSSARELAVALLNRPEVKEVAVYQDDKLVWSESCCRASTEQ